MQEWHVREIYKTLQADQTWGLHYMDDDYAKTLVTAGDAFAMVRKTATPISTTTEVLGCAGVWHISEHRAESWALVSQYIGSCFFKFHKSVLAFLDECQFPRVEMAVDPLFERSHRWATMLGFEKEGRMRKYFPNGGDADLYARIK